MIPTSILIFGGRGAGKTFQAAKLLPLYPNAIWVDTYKPPEHLPSTVTFIRSGDVVDTLRRLDAEGRDVIACLSPRRDTDHDEAVAAMQYGEGGRIFVHMRLGHPWALNRALGIHTLTGGES